jgi:hypothetical protein
MNLQIKPTTVEGSVHPSSNGSHLSAALVYHANVYTLANLRGSLSPPIGDFLSHPISKLRPLKASEPPQKGYSPPLKQTQAIFIAFSASSGQKKVATSPTTRSFKPLILSHQPSTTIETTVSESSPSDLPESTLFGRESRRRISPPPTVTARELHAPPGVFS